MPPLAGGVSGINPATLDAAEPLFEQGLALARQIEDRETTAVALLNLAMVRIGRGAQARASAMLLEAMDIAESIGARRTGGNVLAVSAGLAAVCEDWARAAWLFGAAQSQMRNTGNRLEPADEAFLAPLMTKARGSLAAESFDAAERGARAFSYEQAMTVAREWLMSNASRVAD